MSPARRIVEQDDGDKSHPRHSYALIGHDAALARAARAIRQGRPPQAWLLAGPPGVGKATLAYRIARYLLRYGATDAGPEDLAVAQTDAVSRQIEAGANPGLTVLERRTDDKGKLSSVLKVDEVRRLGSFFGLTSGAGGWRVAMVDSADDMNDNAANALLKVLEEPPKRGILILLSHAPGRLLPTIRSRCQRLDLRPLEPAALDAALQALLPDTKPKERETLAHLSAGAPGLAVRLSGEEGLRLARDAEDLISVSGAPDVPALLALGDRVARASDGLPQFGSFLSAALARNIRERAARGEPALDRWVEAWERISADYTRAADLYLEPRQTVLGSALTLSELKRRSTV
jgi:DNA polymerase-3 subunit delta'